MHKLKEFDIYLVKLHNESYTFVYELDEAFFKLFENSLLEKGKATVKVKLDKKPNCIQTCFGIDGSIELICDRSLEKFDYPIHIEKNVLFKVGDEDKELGEDIYMLDQKEPIINVVQHIYDFVSLSIPMKKLHPKFQEEEEKDTDQLRDNFMV